MNMYWGVEVYRHAFLTPALEGGEWSASRPGRFASRRKSPRYLLDRRLVGPQNRSGRGGDEKIPSPRRESNSQTPIIQPVAQSLYRLSYPASFFVCGTTNFHAILP
jgi:hypothetical protein